MSVFDLPFEAKNLSCIDIESHCTASCGYSLLVGGPCGPSSFKPAHAECVAIGECSKDVYNHLMYCKISDHIAVDSESKLLLTRAGRWFSFRHYKCLFIWTFFQNLTGILISGIFETEQSHLNNSVPTTPRFVWD